MASAILLPILSVVLGGIYIAYYFSAAFQTIEAAFRDPLNSTLINAALNCSLINGTLANNTLINAARNCSLINSTFDAISGPMHVLTVKEATATPPPDLAAVQVPLDLGNYIGFGLSFVPMVVGAMFLFFRVLREYQPINNTPPASTNLSATTANTANTANTTTKESAVTAQ